MTIDVGGGTVITVREDYQKYAAWCKSMGIRPADEKQWSKTTGAIRPLTIGWNLKTRACL